MSGLGQDPGFTGRPEQHVFAGVLLDMDGTLVDSTDAIVKSWHKIGEELGIDPGKVLRTSHGRRTIDTLELFDPSKANWEYVSRVEGWIPKNFGLDAVEIPGARDLLASLEKTGASWAVVTSGTRALATGWLDVMDLAHPQKMVVAEDVSAGKPDPECYQLGKQRLGLDTGAILVIEDSPAGIRAGKAAGCKVLGLATTHDIAQLTASSPTWIVKDLRSVRVIGERTAVGGLTIEISKTLAA